MKRRIASLFLATTTLTILVACQQPKNDNTENRSNPSNTEGVKPNNSPSPSDDQDNDQNDQDNDQNKSNDDRDQDKNDNKPDS